MNIERIDVQERAGTAKAFIARAEVRVNDVLHTAHGVGPTPQSAAQQAVCAAVDYAGYALARTIEAGTEIKVSW